MTFYKWLLIARIWAFVHVAAFRDQSALSSTTCPPQPQLTPPFYDSRCLTNMKKEPLCRLRSELAGARSSNRASVLSRDIFPAAPAADDDDVGRLAGFSGDLYSMTAPPFILSPISLTGSHVPPASPRPPCSPLLILDRIRSVLAGTTRVIRRYRQRCQRGRSRPPRPQMVHRPFSLQLAHGNPC